ncbi:ras-related protein Rab-39B [Glossophaga mutica]
MLLPFHHLCEHSIYPSALPAPGPTSPRASSSDVLATHLDPDGASLCEALAGRPLSPHGARDKTCGARAMEAIWLYQFRLIVIGDSTVGKSCLIRRFTEGRFAQVSDPTVGVDFFSRLVEIEPGKRIKLQIWDTAGQERFRSITRAYYRNSVGGLLLFDITNRRSFQNVHEWLEETKVHVQPYQIVFVLVGHKCDLDTQRQVTRHEAEKLAAAYGMKYIETSARDAINVEKAFTDLTKDIYELVKRGDITIQEGWEGVKSGFVPNVVHSSEEVVKSERRCLC